MELQPAETPGVTAVTTINRNALVATSTGYGWSAIYATNDIGAAVQGGATGSGGVGVYTSSSGPSGRAVSASVTGASAYGIVCDAAGPSSIGIAVSASNTDGIALSAAGETAALLYGHSRGAEIEGDSALFSRGAIYAGFFEGKLQCNNGDMVHTGTGAKSFQIDHPLDPENRFLFHACVESPEQKNIYDGVIETNDQGEATVELPNYFESLNNTWRYQLCAIGGPAPDLHIKSEIVDNKFTIAGARSNQKVCWQVTGVRNDPAARLRPFIAERNKASAERGLYACPEAYGHGDDKAVVRKPIRRDTTVPVISIPVP